MQIKIDAFRRSGALRIGIKLVVSIAFTELAIMLVFRAIDIETRLPSIAIDLIDAVALSIAASLMIFYWVVNPMKIVEERKKTQQALELFRHLVDQSGDALFVIDPKTGCFLDANRSACIGLGYSREELLKMNVTGIDTTVPDIDTWRTQIETVRESGHTILEGHPRRKDGTTFPAEIGLKHVSGGNDDRIIAVVRDITKRKLAEESLKEQKRFAESLIENSAIAAFVLDPQHKVIFWNKASEELTGVMASEITGTSNQWKPFYARQQPCLADVVIDGDLEKLAVLYTTYSKSTLSPDGMHAEGWYKNLNGKDRYILFDAAPIYDSKGKLIAAIETLQDISDRKHAEEQVRFLAYYDSLTGLPNRNFFKELLSRTITQACRYKQVFAIVLIDLDDFKRINDTLGHDAGDELLKAVTKRLLGCIRDSDYAAHLSIDNTEPLARFGGDEFMVLLNTLADVQDAGRVSRRILTELSRPYNLSGQEAFVNASIGIAMYLSDGTDADNLFKNVDAALNHAKIKGKNNYQFYSKTMNVAALEILTMENDLHKALERNELLVYYQPKIDSWTRQIIGMEALIRWKRPSVGLVPPSAFIPLAEASGLIIPIGKFVLHTACLQNKMWQDAGLRTLCVAVNLSSRQFDQKNLLEEIDEVLKSTGLSPQCLEIEITESMIMQNPEDAIRTLLKLKEAGIKISIDDFGTGYSSLSYLRRLPLDALKIDISFIRNVVTNPNDAVIVRTIITMAHSLGLKVIAEGVENEEQMAFLQQEGCDVIQGFLFNPPLPSDQFTELLTAHP